MAFTQLIKNDTRSDNKRLVRIKSDGVRATINIGREIREKLSFGLGMDVAVALGTGNDAGKIAIVASDRLDRNAYSLNLGNTITLKNEAIGLPLGEFPATSVEFSVVDGTLVVDLISLIKSSARKRPDQPMTRSSGAVVDKLKLLSSSQA